jgi:hypothetical protein
MNEKVKNAHYYPIYSGEPKIVKDIDNELYQLSSKEQYKTQGIVIICVPTGIICTAQVGGIQYAHPSVEGYSIPLIVNTWDYEKECREL